MNLSKQKSLKLIDKNDPKHQIGLKENKTGECTRENYQNS